MKWLEILKRTRDRNTEEDYENNDNKVLQLMPTDAQTRRRQRMFRRDTRLR